MLKWHFFQTFSWTDVANIYESSFFLLAMVGRSLQVLTDFSLAVKAATLIFISGRGSAMSSTKQGKLGSIGEE